ncbi:hypothetical protein [Pseudoxanthomonas japonensis]|uniref:Uncharacterized protein n=1 Tax=Pseudoxanthomonas japonensis TaxID=69284 RepID=A0ABQ6ZHT9_9GAMM|nr:hypothetical protein [Pseudoxanthomonas japonensis]KAF1725495.1 hypothetical protein CSC78_08500 [Pseudoxanthomonas japonensis]
MTDSIALGFWAKHCWAMELLNVEEDDDLPEELKSIRSNERFGDMVNEVITSAERDALLLLGGIQHDIEAELCRKGSPFKVMRKRSSDPWQLNLHFQPRRGGKDSFKAEVGARIYESSERNMKLAVWIWAKGGRSAEKTFTEILAGTIEASMDKNNGWASGVAFLFNEPLASPMFAGMAEGSVDLLKVRGAAREALARQDNDRLLRLVRELRN